MITRILNPFYEASAFHPANNAQPTDSQPTNLVTSPVIAHIPIEPETPQPSVMHQELLVGHRVGRGPRLNRARGTQPYPQSRVTRSVSPDSVSEGGSEIDSADTLILKPEGEAGRPGRGGYNLEVAVGWPIRDYSRLKDHVHGLAAEHLDETLSFSKQRASSVQLVQTLALEAFPALREYNKLWPVSDLLKLRLKATSSIARKRGEGAVNA